MDGREYLKWDSRSRKKWGEGSFHNSWVAPWDTGHQLSYQISISAFSTGNSWRTSWSSSPWILDSQSIPMAVNCCCLAGWRMMLVKRIYLKSQEIKQFGQDKCIARQLLPAILQPGSEMGYPLV